MPRHPRPRFTLPSRRHAGLACGAVSIGVVGALLLGPSPVSPTAAPEQDPPEDSIVGKRFEDVATAELTGSKGKTETPAFVARQVIIGFEPDATPAQRKAAIELVDGDLKERLPMPGVVLVRLRGSVGVEAAQQRIDSLPGVRYAEPNGIYQVSDTTPTDPYYPFLWGMENTGQEVLAVRGIPDADIDAGAAWDITKGSRDVVAAVVDTGVDFEHEDLAEQIWTNPRDPKNGIDDDRNGYLDDTHGWDFVNADARPDDDHYHGTHVAGTIAARTDDGKGVVGVAPNSAIMPLKALDSRGSGSWSAISSAFAYAGASGVPVANASLGGTSFSQAMLDSIKAYPNTLYVIAAGNSAISNETNPHYPCSYDAANIICVAATDSSDSLATFSNWGATRVDLAAPGVKILSDVPGIGGDVRKVLFAEDFEEPLPETWTTTGTTGRWGVTDEKAYSGNGSLTDRPYEAYRAGDAGRIYSPPFDLRGETDCQWGATGVFDPAHGDTGFSGSQGYMVDGSTNSGSGSGDRGWPFERRGSAPITASDFRFFLEMNAGVQATGGRGVFADDFWLTCANNSPDRPIPPSRYGYLNGTSMATPHVAGAVALLAAAAPQMTAQEMKARILESVDEISSLEGKTVSGGRLNVARALQAETQQSASSVAVTPSKPEGGSSATAAGITEPQPVETSLYGKGRHLPWAEPAETVSEGEAATQAIVPTHSRNNIPPASLLGQRTTSVGGHTMLNGQWGLDNGGQNSGTVDADIDAPEAWTTTRGSSGVTIALIGSGYPLNHPGLADNIATNPGEMGGGRESNGLDDDRNGYIDDWRGLWTNSYASGGRPDPQKTQPVADNHGQGTMAASLIAGDPVEDGQIYGISPETRILPIKVLGGPDWDVGMEQVEGASTDDLLEAITYAGKMKADIAVLPVAGDPPDRLQGMLNAISAFPKTLFIAPTELYYSNGPVPACQSSPANLICVRTSTRTDQLIYPGKSFAGIDLAAPGYDMVATDQEWEYREAANFDGEDIPGTISPASSPALAGAVPGEGMDGGGALAFSPERDLPRGATAKIDFTSIARPADVRSCGTTVRFSRSASLEQTIGIRSWADPFYRKYTTGRVSGRGRFTELTSFWGGLMESASLGWLRKWSVYTSAPAESWTSRDLIDSFGYTCPKTEPSGDALAWSGDNLKPEYWGLDAALVGGTASLVKAEHPGFTPAQLKRALVEGADSIPALTASIPAGRRLNAAGALAAAEMIEPPSTQPQVAITDAAEITNDPTPSIGLWSKGAERIECGFEDDSSGVLAWRDCSSLTEHTPAIGLADGTYTFRVRASGQSGSSASDSAVITIDTESPTAPTRRSAPNTPTNLSSGYLWFNLSGERDATFECRFDGIHDWTNCGRVDRFAENSEAEYDLYADGRDGAFSPSDGDFTFRARQVDRAGNVSPEFTYPVTIDRVAPGPANLTSAPAKTLRTNAAAFVWTRDASSWLTEVYLDGARTVLIGGSTGAAATSRYTFRGLSDGIHVARFVVRDQANNYAQPIEYSFEVQTDPLLDAPVFDPANPLLTRSFPVIWFSGSNAGTYECSVDGAAFVACTPPWTRSTTIYPTFKEGLHNLRVRQIDRDGVRGPAAEFTWTVDSTPPAAPTISSGPNGFTSSRAATFSFSGEADATFECRLDLGPWNACASGKSYEALSEGSHTFQIQQTDRAGNSSTLASRSWTVDTTPPATPSFSTGPSGLVNSKAASFAFTGAGSEGFLCSLDNAAFSACSSPSSLTSLAEGPHTFEIKRRDAAGNESAVTSRSWTVDSVAPTAPEVSAAPAGTLASSSAQFSFSGEVDASFLCSLDGGLPTECASPKTFSQLGDGSHTVRIRQRDRAGNTSPAFETTWTVDTTAPAAPTILFGPEEVLASDSAEFIFSGEPGGSFLCSLDETAFTDCSSTETFNGLQDGAHTFRVKQRDAAGNESPAKLLGWIVDTTAPDAPEIDSGPSPRTGLNTALFRFSGEEAASFECSLDEAEFQSCVSPRLFVDLDDGEHGFRIRQTDMAGHTSGVATHAWTVDTSPGGAPPITSAPDSVSTSNSAVIEFLGDDDSTFVCSLDGSQFSECASPTVYSGLSQGPHSFSVRQIDPQNNTSPANSIEWSIDSIAPNQPEIITPAEEFISQTAISLAFETEIGAKAFCSLDGSEPAECFSPFVDTTLSEGPHRLSIFARDSAGNSSLETTHSWTVDSVTPSAPTIDSGPTGLTQARVASFGFSGEANAGFQCLLDAGVWSECTAPKAFASLTDGLHTFRVKQSDRAGNVSLESIRTWTVDGTAPTLQRVRQTKKTLPYTFALTLTETGSGLSSIEFSNARTRPSAGASPKITYPLRGTTITLRLATAPTFARVRDAAGNWSGWTAVTN